jgi:hypothetical protein
MSKKTTGVLAITVFVLAPLTAFAAADREQIENYCTQEAQEKGVSADKLEEYVANCVATNLKAEEEQEEGEAMEKKPE